MITPGSFTVTAGGPRNFTNTPSQSENEPALTSDAKWVAYTAGQGVTVAPTGAVQSGVSVPLPELDNGSIGAVVYSETNTVHVITNPTGATPSDLVVFNGTASGIGGISDPEFSPDLTRIVFSGFKDGNRDIFSINRFGGTPRRVTSDSRADVQPTWSAKGRIIFVRQAGPGGTGDLFSIRPDGTDEFRLTNDSINDVAPTASPEGDQVAWERPESGWDIVTMNVDGTGGMTNLTATTDGNALSPDWSADGTQIAFHLFFFPFGPNDTDVYTVGVDSGSPVNVTSTSGKPETNPLWAGDGSALLYQTGGSFETISLEGGGTVTPVSIAGASDWAVVRPLFFSPAWGGHADADSHLAYVFGGNLFVVPVDLSGDAPVFGEPVQIWSNSDGTDFRVVSPTISNDDSTVVFVVEEYADDLFYGVVDEDESYSFVNNGNLDGTGFYRSASFAHGGTDGEVLAAQIDGPGGFPQIWSSGFDLSDQSVNFGSEPLVPGPAFSPSWGTDGRLAFGRDDDIWVWTPPVIEGDGTEELVFDSGARPSSRGRHLRVRATHRNNRVPAGGHLHRQSRQRHRHQGRGDGRQRSRTTASTCSSTARGSRT